MCRKPIRAAGGLLAAVAISLGFFDAGVANAGTLTVNFTSSGASCGLFSVNGDVSSPFGYSTCGALDLDYTPFLSNPQHVPAGTRIAMQTTAPPGITIDTALAEGSIYNLNNGRGWGGGSYCGSGCGSEWHSGDTTELDRNIDSNYWGFAIICGWASCSNPASIFLDSVTVTATENRGPGLLALGSNNLWYQAKRYIWNAPGDPWPITLAASDPSGVCKMWAIVDSSELQGPSATPNTSEWQQCPDPTWTTPDGARVDTRDYVQGSGRLTLALGASNAAGVPSFVGETLNVDNDPVRVSLSTPTDPNPSVWVNHPVTVRARASAGPSGVGGIDCSAHGSRAKPYPAHGITLDGDGIHTLTCTGWNRAIDPEGSPASGTASIAVHIDQAPPSLSFEARNPGDPTGLIVDTSDRESGVAGGSIEIAPAGTSDWKSLPTNFDGSQLLAHFDDAGLHGDYAFRASSCDNVGNCASTNETLALPVRLGAISDVSLEKIADPLKAEKVKERVRVGWHWVAVLRHGKAVKVKRGGHLKTITVIRRVEQCTRKRTRTSTHHWTIRRICKAPKIELKGTEQVGHGKPVTVHGLLMTTQRVPLSGQPVRILTAPQNGSGTFRQIATVASAPDGSWSATLPAGPSRIIKAAYAGSGRVLPATGQATVDVPARIALSIAPREAPWNATITIRGHLEGGYVPPDGVALRLLVRYPGSELGSPLLALRTNAHGGFKIEWSYHAGRGITSYPFWVSTTATESDYPFAAANSRSITVTFGRPTPPAATSRKPPRHTHRRRTHAHRPQRSGHRRRR